MLYERNTVPDNWVAADFLMRLQRNVNLQVFDLSTIMLYSGLVFQQLCRYGFHFFSHFKSICIFVTFFVFLLWERVTPLYLSIVILLVSVFTFMLWFFWSLSSDERNIKVRKSDRSRFLTYFCCDLSKPDHVLVSTPLRTVLIILVFSSALAPVLHSLLDTVSTDTIYAMTAIFLFLNFVSLPYASGMRPSRGDGTADSNIVSVATGFLASLCMASRLPGPKETLLLIISATLVFATWPTIRHRIQVLKGVKSRLSFTLGMGVTAALSLLPFFLDDGIESVYKGLIAVATLLSAVLINFALPLIFYEMQSTKSNINGPWDEAVIEH
ncbi:unnamed protein product [Hydatigera taeniaeformis]|uniref:Phosphatidylinositol N-acetylglucosaminyltransferase subunit C n=1 Tax=Hydatigena taeniaeformis TaxID=6205 RepID=A0A0R3XAZ2_HYDTA|nr:unnamed protein product [Hydatigera taeniaeformis]